MPDGACPVPSTGGASGIESSSSRLLLHYATDGHRCTQALTSRLLDCQDEIRRLRDLLHVLDDAFCSHHHGDTSHMVPYGALSRHVEESLRCLGAELDDLVGLLRQSQER